jgi:hypothetical protein
VVAPEKVVTALPAMSTLANFGLPERQSLNRKI